MSSSTMDLGLCVFFLAIATSLGPCAASDVRCDFRLCPSKAFIALVLPSTASLIVSSFEWLSGSIALSTTALRFFFLACCRAIAAFRTASRGDMDWCWEACTAVLSGIEDEDDVAANVVFFFFIVSFCSSLYVAPASAVGGGGGEVELHTFTTVTTPK